MLLRFVAVAALAADWSLGCRPPDVWALGPPAPPAAAAQQQPGGPVRVTIRGETLELGEPLEVGAVLHFRRVGCWRYLGGRRFAEVSAAKLANGPPPARSARRYRVAAIGRAGWTWPGGTETSLKRHLATFGLHVRIFRRSGLAPSIAYALTFAQARRVHDNHHNAGRSGITAAPRALRSQNPTSRITPRPRLVAPRRARRNCPT